jgi:hypothetical protein
MKWASGILIFALIFITSVTIYLVRQGAALRSAGVIKPSEIGSDFDVIGRSLALRMFPEFQSSPKVIWYFHPDQESLLRIARVAHLNLQLDPKPELIDARFLAKAPECSGPCWIISNAAIPDIEKSSVLEIWTEFFDRDEPVPPKCHQQKIMEPDCVRPISIREVHRKLKSENPHFFMRRYLEREFFLYIEKSAQLN